MVTNRAIDPSWTPGVETTRQRFTGGQLSIIAGITVHLRRNTHFVVGAALRGEAWWGEFLVFGPPLAIASAVCAAGSLAVGRRAERRELPGDSGHPAEAERTEDEKRELPGRGD